MTVVIDIGCAKWGSDESIPYLIETFKPTALYGFDPALDGSEDVTILDSDPQTWVMLRPWCAWVHDGHVGFKVAGLGGKVEADAPSYPCFDLARFILELDEEKIVLKMDAEGAEYELLPHLREHDADLRLKLAWVEWHCEYCGLGGNGRHRDNCQGNAEAWWQRRRALEADMRCEMQEWNR